MTFDIYSCSNRIRLNLLFSRFRVKDKSDRATVEQVNHLIIITFNSMPCFMFSMNILEEDFYIETSPSAGSGSQNKNDPLQNAQSWNHLWDQWVYQHRERGEKHKNTLCLSVCLSVCLCLNLNVVLKPPGQRVPRHHSRWREQSDQDLQDVHLTVQGPWQICQRRVQVQRCLQHGLVTSVKIHTHTNPWAAAQASRPSSVLPLCFLQVSPWLLQRQPQEDGAHLGREGDEEPPQVS